VVAIGLRIFITATLLMMALPCVSTAARAEQNVVTAFESIEIAQPVIAAKIDWEKQAVGNLSAAWVKGNALGSSHGGGAKTRGDRHYWIVSVDILSKETMKVLHVAVVVIDAATGEVAS